MQTTDEEFIAAWELLYGNQWVGMYTALGFKSQFYSSKGGISKLNTLVRSGYMEYNRNKDAYRLLERV